MMQPIQNVKTIFLLKLVCVAMIAIACTTVNFSNKESDWEKMNLKGKVKSITRLSYPYKSGLKSSSSFLSNVDYYLFLESPVRDYKISFTDDGFLKEKKEYSYSLSTKQQSLKRRDVLEYDNNSFLKTKKEFTGDGSLHSIYSYTYNDQGLLIKADRGEKGTVKGRYEYQYSDEKKLTKELYFQTSTGLPDKHKYTTTYKYDSKGNQIAKSKRVEGRNGRGGYDDDRYNYIYNELNQKIEQLKFSKRYHTPRIQNYEYDTFGNLTKISVPESNWEITYQYKYDEQDNWTTKIISKKGGRMYLVEREITYF